jgi:hypothetical protein
MGYGEGSVMKVANLFLVSAAMGGLAVTLGLTAGCSDESFVTSIEDASTSDAATDASSLDATSSDASADVDAAPTKFCDGLVPAPALCADFDRGEPAEFDWQRSDIQPEGTGTLTIDTTQSRSAPASLVFRSNYPAGGGGTNWVGRDISAPDQAKITLDYDLFVVDIANAFSVWVSTLKFVDTSRAGDYLVIFSAKANGAALEERMPPTDGGKPYNAVPAIRFPIVAQWTHVTVVVDMKKPVPTVKIDLDGQPAIPEEPLTDGYMRGLTQLDIGMPFASNVSGSVALRIDNVVLRVVP